MKKLFFLSVCILSTQATLPTPTMTQVMVIMVPIMVQQTKFNNTKPSQYIEPKRLPIINNRGNKYKKTNMSMLHKHATR